MRYFRQISIVLLSVFFLVSCEKDSKNGNKEEKQFIVAFKEQSFSYGEIKDKQEIEVAFSEVALVDGSIEIKVVPVKATYNVDFKTIPETEQTVLTIPFKKGDTKTTFLFQNLIYPYDRTDKTIQFNIAKVNYSAQEVKIQGNDVMVVSFDTAIGGIMQPMIGGPAQPNQVYVDLGGKAMYPIRRDSWDLAFYSGNEFRVKLNGSVYMAAGQLNKTDIDKVSESDVADLKNLVKIGTFEADNIAYIDFPSGDLKRTAIKEISISDLDNKVYLLNLGFEPGKGNVQAGSVEVTGKERGWKKIRVLRQNDGYLLQYADIDSNQHKEVFIPKKPGFNFNFFSFNSNAIIDVEPSSNKWDLNFTVFTNTVDQNGDPKGSYGFSDFIVTNRYSGVVAYKLTIPKENKNYYKNFELKDIDQKLFDNDLRTIGGTWRDVANDKKLFNDVFYVIKDTKGNFYKMRVLNFMNEKGERGYPRFEYKLLR
ncbi:MAG: HmuY family protein [Flavobacteriaceae bacterium]|nr:HmuY family protein [Flavobacteriaceae bacterium]